MVTTSSLVRGNGAAAARRGFMAISPVGIVALGALATIGVLGVLFTQILAEGRGTAEYRDRLDLSIETRAMARRVYAALQEAESEERGYIVTGDSEFLSSYERAVGLLPHLFDQLLRLSADTPQHSTALHLQELSRPGRSLLYEAIRTRREVGQAAAMEIVRDKRGKRQMDQIRTVIDDLISSENRDIATYSAAVRERTARFEAITLALLIATGLLAVGAAAVTGRYIVHRRRSEEELHLAKRLAEEASRAKTEFLASMSHEIRTPLNGIIGYTELLFDQNLTPDQRRYLERIHFAGSALLTIVDDVLDFSKIEAGRMDLNPHPFSLEALIDNTVSVVQRGAEAKGLAMKLAMDPGIPEALYGDEARLRQVLLNLLNNAVKFTSEGSVTLEVRCHSASDCETIRFAVSDTGIGIPQDRREDLFRRFSQVDHSTTREFGGTGLGLAISKRLVGLMGGEIGFASEEEKGSTFWFTVRLPRAPSHSPIQNANAASRAVAIPGRILLVEDLEHNRDLARTVLTGAGYEVDVAENGAEAVAAVQASTYDVILMDIQMPVMDGMTATRTIRALDHPASRIPIIAMSANVLLQQVRSFREAGMNDHVGKPFKKAELIQKLNTWITKAKLEGNGAGTAEKPAFDDLCELMGRDWVASGLAKLRNQIHEAFENEPAATADRQQLAGRAHALVSHAALLGFAELSQLCSELEEASTNGRDLSSIFQQARQAALVATTEASERLESIAA